MWAWVAWTACDEQPLKQPDPPEPASFCEVNGFGRVEPWNSEGPYGVVRHALAADTDLPLTDGTRFSLASSWTGCESYVFVPDTLPRSELDARPVWSRDLRLLLNTSPRNAHYLLLASDPAGVRLATAEVERVLSEAEPGDRAWWTERLHVVDQPMGELDGWVSEVASGIGQLGFAIDRSQRLRGLGSLADVTRDVFGADWPWENNLAAAAHEVEWFNAEAAREDRLDAVDATVIPLWTGEVLSQFAEVDVALPDLSSFDTLELDVDQRCPDPSLPEVGNCGAWDYLAALSVYDGDERVELGRFITTYHREARWVLDVSPMLAHLRDGGDRRFRWEWAPYWNVQPTETRLSLRLSNQGKGATPRRAVRLATGGPFGSAYDDGRAPVVVDIPASATKVELVATISGHGAGTNGCAEFCDHEHTFTVAGQAPHRISFPEAGTETGCIPGIAAQMTPNQWGTWWFGRGGWCPGQPVFPHVVDLTDEVVPGEPATVTYEGTFQGGSPPDGSGDILLESWLVISE